MVEFKEIHPVCFPYLTDIRSGKLGIIGAVHTVIHLFLCKIIKVAEEDFSRDLLIRSSYHVLNFKGQFRNIRRHIEPLVLSKAAYYSLSTGFFVHTSSCRNVKHFISLFFKKYAFKDWQPTRAHSNIPEGRRLPQL